MCKDQTKDQMERALVCFASQCDLSQLQELNVKEWTRKARQDKVYNTCLKGSGFTDLREAPQHGDAFICCVLSHGNKGNVSGIDRQLLPIEQIRKTFMATQSPLTDKPKVFLIQACQGPGVLLKDPLADDSHSTSIPQEADFLFHYATVEGHNALRSPTEGSGFIQSVCKQLKVGCERKEEIQVILRRVNNEVAGKDCPVKQMPEIRHTLRKGLVLIPNPNSGEIMTDLLEKIKGEHQDVAKVLQEERSKVVNKWKAKLVYQMVVTGTTFDAHVQLMEKVKKDVKDQFDLVQSYSNDYDVTIVFCPIVSRMGPDVESAMRDVKVSSGDKPVILVLMHHAYEAKFIPNVQQGANVQLQVNVFFHETKHGLLHCRENGAVVCEITKHLKEIPIPNAQVVAAAVAELGGGWEWPSWQLRWPYQTPSPPPSNQKPVKQPPPTRVNNGNPSKEERSKVVNKRKAKLVYQMVVTGTTFDAHVQLMEKVKKDVKDQFDLVQSYSNDYDVTIVFCPIVSRMGPDVESAMRDVKGDKPVILVLMHHAYEAKFIPNVQQGANVQLQVNVFFHETKHGLLHCRENGAVVCEITKYLKEIPITNAQVVAAAVAELGGGWEWPSWQLRWPYQTPSPPPSNQKPVKQPPPTRVNNGNPSKEEPSKVVNKRKAKLVYQMVVTGTTFDAHVQLMEKVKKDVKDQFDLVQSYSNDYDVTIVFCPIVSRMGPDVESAMRDVKVSSGDKPVILVLMHHAYEVKFIPNVQQGANVQLQVNVFFHETKHGLLHCRENGAVVCEITKYLKEIPIPNAQVVAAAVAELGGGWEWPSWPPRWPHQTPSNQKPVKQPPPTGVNNGIPSRDNQPQMRKEDGQYELNSQPTGLCVIINNAHFLDGDVRDGTDIDAGEIMTDLLEKIKGEHQDVAKVLQDAGLRSDSDIRSLTGAELHQLLPGKEDLKLRRTIFEMIHKQKPVGQLLREMKNFIPNEDFKAALTGNRVLVDYLCIMKDMQTHVKHIQSFQEAHIRFLEENIQNQPDPESATILKEPLCDVPPQEAHGHSSDLLEKIGNRERDAADVLQKADLCSDSDIRSLTREKTARAVSWNKELKLRRRIFEIIQNQKPVKQLPPTGVNNGIPSKGEVMSDLLKKIKGEHRDVAKVLQEAGLRSNSDIRSLTGAELHQLLPENKDLKLRRTIFEMIHEQEPVGQLLREIKSFIPNEDFFVIY
ncbi:uncharacterized protein LOC117492692 [Trematomus bernacchii]|uniref:uncharacterized protein LOC117492692 n=1 Tax=Trematomus bernacchii TaxID=40690 RepID=UPI00146E7566|nr:uncharacterized protein LOC117492692 [Trematomus bernacchii]